MRPCRSLADHGDRGCVAGKEDMGRKGDDKGATRWWLNHQHVCIFFHYRLIEHILVQICRRIRGDQHDADSLRLPN